MVEAGAGGPLVLIHGVGMRAEAWEPQIAALSGNFRVIAVDMPGHGGSDALAGAPELVDYIAWAARVLQALNCGPVAVAGHSMGALIALGLAVEHAGQVSRVALLNAVHRRSEAARAAVLARADEIAQGGGEIDGPLGRWFGPEQAGLRDQVGAWLRDVPRAGYAAAYHAFAGGDEVYADRLGEIGCPVLVLTGDGDANSTVEMTRAMAAMAPLGRAEVIVGHRHMVNLTAPEQVSAALQRWMTTEGIAA